MRTLALSILAALLFAACCCPTQEGCFFTGHSACPKCWFNHDYPCP